MNAAQTASTEELFMELMARLEAMGRIPGIGVRPVRLSARELEVLHAAARGLTNKEIAHELGLSLNTVKGHIAGICHKCKACSRTEAVVVAMRQGIIR
jgi:DNA-binding NarL/FixJ family response regulator